MISAIYEGKVHSKTMLSHTPLLLYPCNNSFSKGKPSLGQRRDFIVIKHKYVKKNPPHPPLSWIEAFEVWTESSNRLFSLYILYLLFLNPSVIQEVKMSDKIA